MSGTGRHLRRAGVVSALAVSLSLGGCAVYHSDTGDSFSSAGLASLGAGAGIPIQVTGTVAGARGASLATAIAADMPQRIGGADVRYAPCAPYTECPGDHVVWTFSPPAARPALDYPAALHVDVAGIMTLLPYSHNVTATVAVFQGGNVVASAESQISAPNGVDDPAFKSMIEEMSDSVLSSGLFDFLDHNNPLD